MPFFRKKRILFNLVTSNLIVLILASDFKLGFQIREILGSD